MRAASVILASCASRGVVNIQSPSTRVSIRSVIAKQTLASRRWAWHAHGITGHQGARNNVGHLHQVHRARGLARTSVFCLTIYRSKIALFEIETGLLCGFHAQIPAAAYVLDRFRLFPAKLGAAQLFSGSCGTSTVEHRGHSTLALKSLPPLKTPVPNTPSPSQRPCRRECHPLLSQGTQPAPHSCLHVWQACPTTIALLLEDGQWLLTGDPSSRLPHPSTPPAIPGQTPAANIPTPTPRSPSKLGNASLVTAQLDVGSSSNSDLMAAQPPLQTAGSGAGCRRSHPLSCPLPPGPRPTLCLPPHPPHWPRRRSGHVSLAAYGGEFHTLSPRNIHTSDGVPAASAVTEGHQHCCRPGAFGCRLAEHRTGLASIPHTSRLRTGPRKGTQTLRISPDFSFLCAPQGPSIVQSLPLTAPLHEHAA